MTAQPDIIWNEQCLGIRIGEQVCTYLKKHDAEYQRLQNKILELTERYPVRTGCRKILHPDRKQAGRWICHCGKHHIHRREYCGDPETGNGR